MQWIGIKPSQLNVQQMMDRLIPLSTRDQKKIIRLLHRPVVVENAELRRELSIMLHLGYKAEIQILSNPELYQYIQ